MLRPSDRVDDDSALWSVVAVVSTSEVDESSSAVQSVSDVALVSAAEFVSTVDVVSTVADVSVSAVATVSDTGLLCTASESVAPLPVDTSVVEPKSVGAVVAAESVAAESPRSAAGAEAVVAADSDAVECVAFVSDEESPRSAAGADAVVADSEEVAVECVAFVSDDTVLSVPDLVALSVPDLVALSVAVDVRSDSLTSVVPVISAVDEAGLVSPTAASVDTVSFVTDEPSVTVLEDPSRPNLVDTQESAPVDDAVAVSEIVTSSGALAADVDAAVTGVAVVG